MHLFVPIENKQNKKISQEVQLVKSTKRCLPVSNYNNGQQQFHSKGDVATFIECA